VNESISQSEPPPNSEERTMALFANLVVQQTNMALMFLGRVPHPESGEPVRDLNAARMFIDQLEMLETKTKGNLDKREEALLKQSLTSLRMAFVEAVNEEPSAPPKKEPAKAATAPPTAPAGAREPASAPGESSTEAESRKKFSKKY